VNGSDRTDLNSGWLTTQILPWKADIYWDLAGVRWLKKDNFLGVKIDTFFVRLGLKSLRKSVNFATWMECR
jgi:hypothetical protein